MCTLDGLIAEHKFRVWVTILGRMSLHFQKYEVSKFGLLDKLGRGESQMRLMSDVVFNHVRVFIHVLSTEACLNIKSKPVAAGLY